LIIDSVTKELAGTYTCQDLSSSEKPLSAELIVLEDHPSCKMNTSTQGVAINIPVLFSCGVSFVGNLAPVMKWTDELGQEIDMTFVHSNSSSLETGVIMTAAMPQLRSLTCRTYFQEPPVLPPAPILPAMNAPNYTSSWTSPVVETVYVKDCAEIKSLHSDVGNGVYFVKLTSDLDLTKVYCDMITAGGGWTVFQRRIFGSELFYRPWSEYAEGFGDVAGEFWLGNDNLNSLTVSEQYRLRVDLGDWQGEYRFAQYDNFRVATLTDKYRLAQLGRYSGDAGDAMTYHLGMQFSTYDDDNDAHNDINCAEGAHGGWWYRDCHNSNLNGEYNNTATAQGNTWYQWLGHEYPLRFTEMKIRPVTFSKH